MLNADVAVDGQLTYGNAPFGGDADTVNSYDDVTNHPSLDATQQQPRPISLASNSTSVRSFINTTHTTTPKNGYWSVIVEAFDADGRKCHDESRAVFFAVAEKKDAEVCFKASTQYAKRLKRENGMRYTITLAAPDTAIRRQKEI